MAKYTRISYNERLRIKQMLIEGKSIGNIAEHLRRSKSSISTEIRRNGMNAKTYHPRSAQKNARFRRKFIKRKKKIRGPLETFIQYLLLEVRCSPEQISNYLKRLYPDDSQFHVSHEAIYWYVYRSPHRDVFTKVFRFKRKQRQSHDKAKTRRGGIRNRVSIHARPSEIENREEPGHWEGDLIIGKGHQSAIGTLVERTTRYTLVVFLTAKTARAVKDAFLGAFESIPSELRKSLTYDQGSEMAQHELFTEMSGISVYFADPGCPWQRGTNENTNGLLREFFPKGTDLSQFSEEEIQSVQSLLNNRPRKVLGYFTPKECFDELIRAYQCRAG